MFVVNFSLKRVLRVKVCLLTHRTTYSTIVISKKFIFSSLLVGRNRGGPLSPVFEISPRVLTEHQLFNMTL